MNDQPVATDGSRRRRLWLAVRWSAAYASTFLPLAWAVWAVSLPVRPVVLDWLVYLACAAIGAAWILAFLVARILKRAQLRNRGVFLWLAMPALVVVCVALIAEEVPASVRLSLSRQALEEAADRAQTGEEVPPASIGLIPVSSVEVEQDGTTLFFVADEEFFYVDCGYAFNPSRTPKLPDPRGAGPNWLSGEPIEVGWWLFCES